MSDPVLLAMAERRAAHFKAEAEFYRELLSDMSSALWRVCTELRLTPQTEVELVGATVVFGMYNIEYIVRTVADLKEQRDAALTIRANADAAARYAGMLHEEHTCRDCGAKITMPYVRPEIGATYTPEQREQVNGLIAAAALASETFGDDELERFAAERQRHTLDDEAPPQA